MTRLLTTGYETGDVNEAGTTVQQGSNTVTVVSSNPAPASGTYCLKSAVPNDFFGAGGPFAVKRFSLPASLATLWVRFRLFPTPSTGNTVVCRFLDSAGGAQMDLVYRANDGKAFFLRPGDNVQVGALSTASLVFNAWNLVAVRMTVHNTTGSADLYLNGGQVITVSGVDTQSTANANVGFVDLGSRRLGSTASFDDIAINDTAGTVNNGNPGDGRVFLLTPNGADGAYQLVGSDADSIDNHLLVDEIPPSTADYVQSDVAGNRDLYTMANLPADTADVFVVEVIALAANDAVGTGLVGLTLKSGATTEERTARPLTTGYAYVTDRWELDPDTAAAWLPADVDALSAGVTVR